MFALVHVCLKLLLGVCTFRLAATTTRGTLHFYSRGVVGDTAALVCQSVQRVYDSLGRIVTVSPLGIETDKTAATARNALTQLQRSR